jgi:divinyl protochlorophyllide a 8-vinyl-reductase
MHAVTLALTEDHARAGARGRIGPNAVIRVAEVLDQEMGAATTRAMFKAAGLSRYLDAMPEQMIDEGEVTALHAVLRDRLGVARARHIGWQAGHRTADYLLAHRIPRIVQALLKRLPSRLSSAILLRAIGRHAWTFAGSGTFSVRPGRPLRLVIAGGPISRGAQAGEAVCDFYAATFERLYRKLVDPRTIAVETACAAAGAAECVFELRF